MPEATITPAAPSLYDQLAVGQVAPVATDPVALVIFGGAGDLAHRKLLPALFNLSIDGLLPARIAIIGAGRKTMTDDQYRAFAKDGIQHFSRRPIDEHTWSTFASALFFANLDMENPSGYGPLKSRIEEVERQRGLTGNRIFYLAVPPTIFVPTVEQLARAELVRERPFTRVIVEKPIGRDLTSARHINDALAAAFAERQIFRIDHYLGKETVQNILVLRFANSLFEPMFNQKYVDHVQITAAEEEGVGTRAGYYEEAGALRDMVQNHMLQLLSLVAMEPPRSLDAEVVRDEKLEVLRSLRPISPAAIAHQVVRAQYSAGFELGAPVPGYREEAGVRPTSTTETFVAIEAFIDNWRWAGVPFFLRTGKRLPKRASEIAVFFRQVPPILFNADPAAPLDPNVLTIRIQPDEGFSFGINSKVPGPRVRVYPVRMDFRYSNTFGAESPEAYERLLLDVMAGDATLFMRRDAVETAWSWVMPILDSWDAAPGTMPTYPAGEWGPAEADQLIAATGRRWRAL